jgi:hypothetical protein
MADAGSPSPDPPPPLLRFHSSSATSTRSVARNGLRAPSTSFRRRTHPKMRRHEPVGSFAVDLEVFLTVPRTRARRPAPLALEVVPATGSGHHASRVSSCHHDARVHTCLPGFRPLLRSQMAASTPRSFRRTTPGLPHPVRSVSRGSHPPDGFLRNHPCRLVSSSSRTWGSSLQSLLAKSRNASRRPLPS